MCLAVPGRILATTGADPLQRMGRVDFGGVIKEINLAFTPEARVDDYVLVHVGFAISCLDAGEAAKVYEHLQVLGEMEVPSGADDEDGDGDDDDDDDDDNEDDDGNKDEDGDKDGEEEKAGAT